MKKTITIIMLLLVVIACKKHRITKKEDLYKIAYNNDSTTVKFTGIVTNAKNDCWADGTCSIEVNNNWWVAIIYGKRDPSRIPKDRGLVTGIRFSKDNKVIGKRVKVYAKIRDKNRLTVEGNNNYYVEVIE